MMNTKLSTPIRLMVALLAVCGLCMGQDFKTTAATVDAKPVPAANTAATTAKTAPAAHVTGFKPATPSISRSN
jgi:hypothetical protein